MSELRVQAFDDHTIVDDGSARHTFTDGDAQRLFIHTWRALQPLGVVFTLNDDATIATWANGNQPTPQQITALVAALVAAETQTVMDASALRTRVLALAQSSVGVQIDALTAAQIRALVALLLYKQGAIDKNGAVLPLGTWV